MSPTRRKKLGDYFSEGARQLWLAIEARGMSQNKAELQIGAPNGVLNRWLYGVRRPGMKYVFAIQQHFAIAPESWREASRLPFVAPAARPTGRKRAASPRSGRSRQIAAKAPNA